MPTVRVGFIGAGNMANAVHYPSVADIPEAMLWAICDLNEERLHRTADKYAVPKERRYTDYRRMLEREPLDAIYVIMPPMGLCPIVLDCLKAGKHVFIEKPPGCNADEAWTMGRKGSDKKSRRWSASTAALLPSIAMPRRKFWSEVSHLWHWRSFTRTCWGKDLTTG